MAETHRIRRSDPVVIAGRPIASLLLPVPIICFLGAVLTDSAYLGSVGNLTWLYFSTWLLAAGLFFGVLAAIAMLADSVRGGRWIAFALFALAWLVELINAFVHARDGWTAVAGLGFILSIIGAILALASGWFAADRREFITTEAE